MWVNMGRFESKDECAIWHRHHHHHQRYQSSQSGKKTLRGKILFLLNKKQRSFENSHFFKIGKELL